MCKQQGHFAKECPGGRDRAHKSPSNTQVESVFGVAPPPPPAPSYAPAAPPSQEQQGYAQYFPPPVQQQPNAHPMLPSNSVPPPYPVGVPPTFAGSHYQAGPTSMMESNKPAHYAEALSSLAPLQAFMNTKLQYSSSSSGYPPSYIELLVTNVGKMFALANLSLPSLEATFFSHGETFLRSRISRELQVCAGKHKTPLFKTLCCSGLCPTVSKGCEHADCDRDHCGVFEDTGWLGQAVLVLMLCFWLMKC